jgi:hypothetical protein
MTQTKAFWNTLLGRHYDRIAKQNARKMREDVLCMQGCFADTPENENIRRILMQLRRELESRM